MTLIFLIRQLPQANEVTIQYIMQYVISMNYMTTVNTTIITSYIITALLHPPME